MLIFYIRLSDTEFQRLFGALFISVVINVEIFRFINQLQTTLRQL